MTLRSVRSMISMVKMPSRKEWAEEDPTLIHLTSSHRSLGPFLEVLFEDNPFSCVTVKRRCTLFCWFNKLLYIFCAQVVVAAAGAEGKGGERM